MKAPPKRGGLPPIRFPRSLTRGHTPQVRGSPRPQVTPELPKTAHPASAGISLTPFVLGNTSERAPRKHGGNPEAGVSVYYSERMCPHIRG